MSNRTFSCPTPSNLSPLSPVGFQFSIQKIPDVTYFAQEVNIPGIILGEPEYGTPFARVPVPGETLQYEPLVVQFLVDEDMTNYKAIYNWIVALGFPETHDQYLNLQDSDNRGLLRELATNYSDATLTVLNSNNRPSETIQFIDMFPTSLDSLQFSSQQGDIQYIVGRAQFRFSYYKFA
jgi:hypothetical protein